MFFLTFLGIFNQDISINDIAFAAWTGGNVMSRIIAMASTCYQFLPTIDVYTDKISKKEYDTMYKSSNHLNLFIHVTPTFNKYLDFTAHDSPYGKAQSRHLYVVYDIYKRYPNKKWYFILDDDSFIQPQILLHILQTNDYNHSKPMLIGAPYGHVNTFTKYTFDNKNTAFVQGGAGILISQAMMKDVAPTIMNCSLMLQSPTYQVDIRLSHCINRYYGTYTGPDQDEKRKYVHSYITNSFRYMNGYEIASKPFKKPGAPALIFHSCKTTEAYYIFNATYSIWRDANGIEKYCDFSFISGTIIYINFHHYGQFVKMIFGVNFELFDPKHTIHAISQFMPIFDENDKERIRPRTFIQKYIEDFEITLNCVDDLNQDEIVFDSFYRTDSKGMKFNATCGDSKTFLFTAKSKTSPKHPIIYDKEDFNY